MKRLEHRFGVGGPPPPRREPSEEVGGGTANPPVGADPAGSAAAARPVDPAAALADMHAGAARLTGGTEAASSAPETPQNLRRRFEEEFVRFRVARDRPDEARRILAGLLALADRIRNLIGTPDSASYSQVFEDLRGLRSFYRAAREFQGRRILDTHLMPDRAEELHNSVTAQIEQALENVEGALRILREGLRPSLTLERGASSTPAQVASARMVVEINLELDDREHIATDSLIYSRLLGALPSSAAGEWTFEAPLAGGGSEDSGPSLLVLDPFSFHLSLDSASERFFNQIHVGVDRSDPTNPREVISGARLDPEYLAQAWGHYLLLNGVHREGDIPAFSGVAWPHLDRLRALADAIRTQIDESPALPYRLQYRRLLAEIYSEILRREGPGDLHHRRDTESLDSVLRAWTRDARSEGVTNDQAISDLIRISQIAHTHRRSEILNGPVHDAIQSLTDELRHPPRDTDPRQRIQNRQLAYLFISEARLAFGDRLNGLFEDLFNDLQSDGGRLEREIREAPNARVRFERQGELAALYRMLRDHPGARDYFQPLYERTLNDIVTTARDSSVPIELRVQVVQETAQLIEREGNVTRAREVLSEFRDLASTYLTDARRARNIADRFELLQQAYVIYRELGDPSQAEEVRDQIRTLLRTVERQAGRLDSEEMRRNFLAFEVEGYLLIGDLDQAETLVNQIHSSLPEDSTVCLETPRAGSEEMSVDDKAQWLMRLGGYYQQIAEARADRTGGSADLTRFRGMLRELGSLGARHGRRTMSLYARFMQAILDNDPAAEQIYEELRNWRPDAPPPSGEPSVTLVATRDWTAEGGFRVEAERPERETVPLVFSLEPPTPYEPDPFQRMAEQLWERHSLLVTVRRTAPTIQYLHLLIEGNYSQRLSQARDEEEPTGPILRERDLMRRYLSEVQTLLSSGRATTTRAAIEMLPQVVGDENAAREFYRILGRTFDYGAPAHMETSHSEIGPYNVTTYRASGWEMVGQSHFVSRLIRLEEISDPNARAAAELSLARDLVVQDSIRHRCDAVIATLLASAEESGMPGHRPRPLMEILRDFFPVLEGRLHGETLTVDHFSELYNRIAGNESLRQQIEAARDVTPYVQGFNVILDQVFSVEGGLIMLASIFTGGLAAELAAGAVIARLGAVAYRAGRLTLAARVAVAGARFGAGFLARSATELGGITLHRGIRGWRHMNAEEVRLRLITSLFSTIGDEVMTWGTRALLSSGSRLVFGTSARVLARTERVINVAEFFTSGLGEMWGEDMGARVAGGPISTDPFWVRYFQETLHGAFFVVGTRVGHPISEAIIHRANEARIRPAVEEMVGSMIPRGLNAEGERLFRESMTRRFLDLALDHDLTPDQVRERLSARNLPELIRIARSMGYREGHPDHVAVVDLLMQRLARGDTLSDLRGLARLSSVIDQIADQSGYNEGHLGRVYFRHLLLERAMTEGWRVRDLRRMMREGTFRITDEGIEHTGSSRRREARESFTGPVERAVRARAEAEAEEEFRGEEGREGSEHGRIRGRVERAIRAREERRIRREMASEGEPEGGPYRDSRESRIRARIEARMAEPEIRREIEETTARRVEARRPRWVERRVAAIRQEDPAVRRAIEEEESFFNRLEEGGMIGLHSEEGIDDVVNFADQISPPRMENGVPVRTEENRRYIQTLLRIVNPGDLQAHGAEGLRIIQGVADRFFPPDAQGRRSLSNYRLVRDLFRLTRFEDLHDPAQIEGLGLALVRRATEAGRREDRSRETEDRRGGGVRRQETGVRRERPEEVGMVPPVRPSVVEGVSTIVSAATAPPVAAAGAPRTVSETTTEVPPAERRVRAREARRSAAGRVATMVQGVLLAVGIMGISSMAQAQDTGARRPSGRGRETPVLVAEAPDSISASSGSHRSPEAPQGPLEGMVLSLDAALPPRRRRRSSERDLEGEGEESGVRGQESEVAPRETDTSTDGRGSRGESGEAETPVETHDTEPAPPPEHVSEGTDTIPSPPPDSMEAPIPATRPPESGVRERNPLRTLDLLDEEGLFVLIEADRHAHEMVRRSTNPVIRDAAQRVIAVWESITQLRSRLMRQEAHERSEADLELLRALQEDWSEAAAVINRVRDTLRTPAGAEASEHPITQFELPADQLVNPRFPRNPPLPTVTVGSSSHAGGETPTVVEGLGPQRDTVASPPPDMVEPSHDTMVVPMGEVHSDAVTLAPDAPAAEGTQVDVAIPAAMEALGATQVDAVIPEMVGEAETTTVYEAPPPVVEATQVDGRIPVSEVAPAAEPTRIDPSVSFADTELQAPPPVSQPARRRVREPTRVQQLPAEAVPRGRNIHHEIRAALEPFGEPYEPSALSRALGPLSNEPGELGAQARRARVLVEEIRGLRARRESRGLNESENARLLEGIAELNALRLVMELHVPRLEAEDRRLREERIAQAQALTPRGERSRRLGRVIQRALGAVLGDRLIVSGEAPHSAMGLQVETAQDLAVLRNHLSENYEIVSAVDAHGREIPPESLEEVPSSSQPVRVVVRDRSDPLGNHSVEMEVYTRESAEAHARDDRARGENDDTRMDIHLEAADRRLAGPPSEVTTVDAHEPAQAAAFDMRGGEQEVIPPAADTEISRPPDMETAEALSEPGEVSVGSGNALVQGQGILSRFFNGLRTTPIWGVIDRMAEGTHVGRGPSVRALRDLILQIRDYVTWLSEDPTNTSVAAILQAKLNQLEPLLVQLEPHIAARQAQESRESRSHAESTSSAPSRTRAFEADLRRVIATIARAIPRRARGGPDDRGVHLVVESLSDMARVHEALSQDFEVVWIADGRATPLTPEMLQDPSVELPIRIRVRSRHSTDAGRTPIEITLRTRDSARIVEESYGPSEETRVDIRLHDSDERPLELDRLGEKTEPTPIPPPDSGSEPPPPPASVDEPEGAAFDMRGGEQPVSPPIGPSESGQTRNLKRPGLDRGREDNTIIETSPEPTHDEIRPEPTIVETSPEPTAVDLSPEPTVVESTPVTAAPDMTLILDRRQILARIAEACGLLREGRFSEFFRTLLTATGGTNFDISAEAFFRVRDIFSDPEVVRALERVTDDQTVALREALLRRILRAENPLTEPSEVVELIRDIRAGVRADEAPTARDSGGEGARRSGLREQVGALQRDMREALRARRAEGVPVIPGESPPSGPLPTLLPDGRSYTVETLPGERPNEIPHTIRMQNTDGSTATVVIHLPAMSDRMLRQIVVHIFRSEAAAPAELQARARELERSVGSIERALARMPAETRSTLREEFLVGFLRGRRSFDQTMNHLIHLMNGAQTFRVDGQAYHVFTEPSGRPGVTHHVIESSLPQANGRLLRVEVDLPEGQALDPVTRNRVLRYAQMLSSRGLSSERGIESLRTEILASGFVPSSHSGTVRLTHRDVVSARVETSLSPDPTVAHGGEAETTQVSPPPVNQEGTTTSHGTDGSGESGGEAHGLTEGESGSGQKSGQGERDTDAEEGHEGDTVVEETGLARTTVRTPTGPQEVETSALGEVTRQVVSPEFATQPARDDGAPSSSPHDDVTRRVVATNVEAPQGELAVGDGWEQVDSPDTPPGYLRARPRIPAGSHAGSEGDLREVFERFPALAALLRGRIHSDGSVTYPDVSAANQRLDEAGFGFRFWSCRGHVPPEDALVHLAMEVPEFPYSSTGGIHFHDFFQHILGYSGTPVRVLLQIRESARFLQRLLNDPRVQNNPELRAEVLSQIRQFVESVDFGTAEVGFTLLSPGRAIGLDARMGQLAPVRPSWVLDLFVSFKMNRSHEVQDAVRALASSHEGSIDRRHDSDIYTDAGVQEMVAEAHARVGPYVPPEGATRQVEYNRVSTPTGSELVVEGHATDPTRRVVNPDFEGRAARSDAPITEEGVVSSESHVEPPAEGPLVGAETSRPQETAVSSEEVARAPQESSASEVTRAGIETPPDQAPPPHLGLGIPEHVPINDAATLETTLRNIARLEGGQAEGDPFPGVLDSMFWQDLAWVLHNAFPGQEVPTALVREFIREARAFSRDCGLAGQNFNSRHFFAHEGLQRANMGHFILGSRPSAEAQIHTMINFLRGCRRIFGAEAGTFLMSEGRLVNEIRDPEGNPTGFFLVVQRGRHEYTSGIEIAIVDTLGVPQQRNGIPLSPRFARLIQEYGYHAKVGVQFGSDGSLQIVNVQGAMNDMDVRMLPGPRLTEALHGAGPLDMLVASTIWLAESNGFSRVEGIRDVSQRARADSFEVVGGREGGGRGYYDLFFRRFGFEPPAEEGDFFSLDLRSLRVRRRKMPPEGSRYESRPVEGSPRGRRRFQVNVGENTLGEYFRQILPRDSRGRSEKWDRTLPEPVVPAAGAAEGEGGTPRVQTFWRMMVPALLNARWGQTLRFRDMGGGPYSDAHPLDPRTRRPVRATEEARRPPSSSEERSAPPPSVEEAARPHAAPTSGDAVETPSPVTDENVVSLRRPRTEETSPPVVDEEPAMAAFDLRSEEGEAVVSSKAVEPPREAPPPEVVDSIRVEAGEGASGGLLGPDMIGELVPDGPPPVEVHLEFSAPHVTTEEGMTGLVESSLPETLARQVRDALRGAASSGRTAVARLILRGANGSENHILLVGPVEILTNPRELRRLLQGEHFNEVPFYVNFIVGSGARGTTIVLSQIQLAPNLRGRGLFRRFAEGWRRLLERNHPGALISALTESPSVIRVFQALYEGVEVLPLSERRPEEVHVSGRIPGGESGTAPRPPESPPPSGSSGTGRGGPGVGGLAVLVGLTGAALTVPSGADAAVLHGQEGGVPPGHESGVLVDSTVDVPTSAAHVTGGMEGGAAMLIGAIGIAGVFQWAGRRIRGLFSRGRTEEPSATPTRTRRGRGQGPYRTLSAPEGTGETSSPTVLQALRSEPTQDVVLAGLRHNDPNVAREAIRILFEIFRHRFEWVTYNVEETRLFGLIPMGTRIVGENASIVRVMDRWTRGDLMSREMVDHLRRALSHSHPDVVTYAAHLLSRIARYAPDRLTPDIVAALREGVAHNDPGVIFQCREALRDIRRARPDLVADEPVSDAIGRALDELDAAAFDQREADQPVETEPTRVRVEVVEEPPPTRVEIPREEEIELSEADLEEVVEVESSRPSERARARRGDEGPGGGMFATGIVGLAMIPGMPHWAQAIFVVVGLGAPMMAAVGGPRGFFRRIAQGARDLLGVESNPGEAHAILSPRSGEPSEVVPRTGEPFVVSLREGRVTLNDSGEGTRYQFWCDANGGWWVRYEADANSRPVHVRSPEGRAIELRPQVSIPVASGFVFGFPREGGAERFVFQAAEPEGLRIIDHSAGGPSGEGGPYRASAVPPSAGPETPIGLCFRPELGGFVPDGYQVSLTPHSIEKGRIGGNRMVAQPVLVEIGSDGTVEVVFQAGLFGGDLQRGQRYRVRMNRAGAERLGLLDPTRAPRAFILQVSLIVERPAMPPPPPASHVPSPDPFRPPRTLEEWRARVPAESRVVAEDGRTEFSLTPMPVSAETMGMTSFQVENVLAGGPGGRLRVVLVDMLGRRVTVLMTRDQARGLSVLNRENQVQVGQRLRPGFPPGVSGDSVVASEIAPGIHRIRNGVNLEGLTAQSPDGVVEIYEGGEGLSPMGATRPTLITGDSRRPARLVARVRRVMEGGRSHLVLEVTPPTDPSRAPHLVDDRGGSVPLSSPTVDLRSAQHVRDLAGATLYQWDGQWIFIPPSGQDLSLPPVELRIPERRGPVGPPIPVVRTRVRVVGDAPPLPPLALSGMEVRSQRADESYSPPESLGNPFESLSTPGDQVVISRRTGVDEGEVFVGQGEGADRLFVLTRTRDGYSIQALEGAMPYGGISVEHEGAPPGRGGRLRPGRVRVVMGEGDFEFTLHVPGVETAAAAAFDMRGSEGAVTRGEDRSPPRPDPTYDFNARVLFGDGSALSEGDGVYYVVEAESMGGNAGAANIGINAYFDLSTGRIIAVGNIQGVRDHLPAEHGEVLFRVWMPISGLVDIYIQLAGLAGGTDLTKLTSLPPGALERMESVMREAEASRRIPSRVVQDLERILDAARLNPGRLHEFFLGRITEAFVRGGSDEARRSLQNLVGAPFQAPLREGNRVIDGRPGRRSR